MKRHAALQDLARDHFHALVCTQQILKAETAEQLESAARALVELWRNDLVYHFREEEEVLLPVLSRHMALSEDEDILTMLEQHARLRDGMRELERRLDGKEEYGDFVRSLGIKLHDHARLEDRVIFGRLETLFTDKDLDDVARLSVRFREQWGRPIGPQ